MKALKNLVSLVICVGALDAAISPPPLPQIPEGTDLVADELECDHKAATCIATGNAKMTRGEGTKQHTLSADKMTAVMATEQGHMVMNETRAEGHTVLTTADGTINANTGTYRPATHQATFEGQTSLRHKGNRLEGEKLTVDMENKTYVLTGQPVEGFIAGEEGKE